MSQRSRALPTRATGLHDEGLSHHSIPAPMPQLYSFPPVIHESTHTLVLGSMPGKLSLSACQYYAHPRNAFWHIMGEIYGAGPDTPYALRLDILLQNGIGLWDVIAACTRTGSLDADITENSIIVNDFQYLLKNYPGILRIFFNGGKAVESFNRYVLPRIDEIPAHLHLQQLTSTSPANARYSVADKILLWRRSLLPG